MAANLTFLYLGCAALLIAAVMLPLPPKLRTGLFTALILSAIVGGQSARVERIPALIVAAAD
jgi:membrane protein implicated in regulation of membrane protease activity